MRTAAGTIDRRTFMTLAAGVVGAVALPGRARAESGDGLPAGSTATGLAAGSARSVAVGSDAGGSAAIWHTDGETWSTASRPPPPTAALSDVAAVAGRFVAVGSLAQTATVWTSDDGDRWQQLTALSGRGHLTSVAVARSRLLVGGASIDDETDESVGALLATVARSGRWGRVVADGLDLAHGSVSAVAAHAGRWVVAGTGSTGTGIWTASTGGWRSAAPTSPIPVVWSSLLSGPAGLLAVGSDLAGGEPRVARSPDGLAWALESVPQALGRLGVDLQATAVAVVGDVVSVLQPTGLTESLRLG